MENFDQMRYFNGVLNVGSPTNLLPLTPLHKMATSNDYTKP